MGRGRLASSGLSPQREGHSSPSPIPNSMCSPARPGGEFNRDTLDIPATRVASGFHCGCFTLDACSLHSFSLWPWRQDTASSRPAKFETSPKPALTSPVPVSECEDGGGETSTNPCFNMGWKERDKYFTNQNAMTEGRLQNN